MTYEQIATFAVLFGALALFVWERLPADVTALLIPIALGLLGVLEPREALAGFGNPAVITVAAMFVLSKALVTSGAVSAVGTLMQRVAAGSERRAMLGVVVVAALCSAFINNTPVVVVFLPMVLAVAADVKAAPSRLLLPLSYGTILGGCCTLIGTSTTVLVSGELATRASRVRAAGGAPDEAVAPIGFFELTPLGLCVLAIGAVYVLVLGPKLLPSRRGVSSMAGTERITEYATEVSVTSRSPLVGKTVREAFLEPHPDLLVVEVVRGPSVLFPVDPELRLRMGDLVLVRGRAKDLAKMDGAALLPELRGEGIRGRDVTLIELVVTNGSPLLGRSVAEAAGRALQGDAVMAVERRGVHLRSGLADLVLREGDTLLVQTEAAKLPRYRGSDDFVLLEGLHEELTLRKKAPYVLGVTLLLVVLASLEVTDVAYLALAAGGALVLGGCLTVRQAYRSLDLGTLVLMGSTVALGTALDRSGAAHLVADGLLDWVRSLGKDAFAPWYALAAVYGLCNVLTAFASNSAAALLTLPIAIETAAKLDVHARPFVVAVVFAASLDFSTPTGYQTNLLVYGPGGYRFSDYVRFGGPLNLLLWAAAVLLIPFFFPF